MKFSYQLLLGAALILGAAIGYCTKSNGTAPSSTAPAKAHRGKLVDDVGKIREKIVERQLVVVTNTVTITNAAFRPHQNPREWLENIRKNDPKRYSEMTNNFARFRRHRQERTAARLSFLASIDDSKMSAEAQGNHRKYQELLAEREELEERMHDENLTDAERGNLMKEMRDTDHQLRRASRTERATLISETATALGLEGELAEDFAATIGDIIDATEVRRNGPPGPPPSAAGGGNAPPPM